MANFDSFKASFKGDLVTPSDADYEKSIIRWAKNASRKANVVAFVKDAQDVSLAIKYAKAQLLSIAVRGGGHNVSGASSSEGGLVVDLSKYLNGVRVDPDKKLAYVGGGAVWKTVDETAIQHGLAGVGGTVNHVSALLLFVILIVKMIILPLLDRCGRVGTILVSVNETTLIIVTHPQVDSWWWLWVVNTRPWTHN